MFSAMMLPFNKMCPVLLAMAANAFRQFMEAAAVNDSLLSAAKKQLPRRPNLEFNGFQIIDRVTVQGNAALGRGTNQMTCETSNCVRGAGKTESIQPGLHELRFRSRA
jgi:hypothetical protein